MESDIELMLKTKAGDDSAFSELMNRHYKGVLNFIYRFTNMKENSEDLAQEVFVSAFQSLSAFRGDRAFVAWLAGIAKNKVKQHLRNENRNTRLQIAR